MKRIVVAYSGGLGTSVAIPWLAEKYGAEIVAVTMDLGQGRELEDAHGRALAIGAVRAHVLDLRDEFARDYILPALQAGAIYEGRYPLSTALGRPLIARKLVDIARLEGADAIAHGCTGDANDQLRIDTPVRALEPGIRVIATAREWGPSRAEALEYAHERGIRVSASSSGPYRTDTNLWGRSIECGVLDDPWQEPPEDVYTLTRSPAEAPDHPAYVDIDFEKGVPVSINGVSMSLVEVIQSLETIAGGQGVGRIDMVENQLTGSKSREVYEAPAAVALHAAHTDLQRFVVPRELERVASSLSVAYADLVYNGQWFTPTREAIDAFVAQVQPQVTGTIRLRLFKGACQVVGRRSPFAPCNRDQPSDAVRQAEPSGVKG